jgi:hypothetical protein
MRCSLSHGHESETFVTLYHHLVGAVARASTAERYDEHSWAETVALITLLETAVSVASPPHSQPNASAAPTAGGGPVPQAGYLAWETVEYLAGAVVELARQSAHLVDVAVSATATATPPEQGSRGVRKTGAVLSESNSSSNSSSAGGDNRSSNGIHSADAFDRGDAGSCGDEVSRSVAVLGAALKFLGTFFACERRQVAGGSVVRALDDTARTFREVVELSGVLQARRWSWERASAVPTESRVHGTVRSLYRFVRHPFVFLGSGGAESKAEFDRNAGLR